MSGGRDGAVHGFSVNLFVGDSHPPTPLHGPTHAQHTNSPRFPHSQPRTGYS
jgi:hypothetical protein